MRKILLSILLLGGLLTGCSEEEIDLKQPVSMEFHLSRADGNALPHQQTRLFVTQRAQEELSQNQNALHCGLKDRYFLNGSSFKLENLLLQWYKFTFVSVPDYPDLSVDGRAGFSDTGAHATAEEKRTTDFTQLFIDYSAVLHLLETDQEADSKYELSLYRGSINRWTSRPNAENLPMEEAVPLKRVSGKLKLVMGNLTDQFAGRVTAIDLHFSKMPHRIYVYDNATFEDHLDASGQLVKSDAQVIPDFSTAEDWTFHYAVSAAEAQGQKECVLCLPLLPHQLLGTYLTVKVDHADQPAEYTFPLVSKEASVPIQIKPNIVTKILFHGMEPDQFKVVYAGYEGTQIEIEDQWNGGWQLP